MLVCRILILQIINSEFQIVKKFDVQDFCEGFSVIRYSSGVGVIVNSRAAALLVYSNGKWTERWKWSDRLPLRGVAELENNHLAFAVMYQEGNCAIIVQNVVTGQVKAMVPCAMGSIMKGVNKKAVCMFDQFCRVEHYDFSDVLH